MALELFNDMNVQMGGKKGRRRKGTKGKRARKGRKGTRSKKRRGGSLSSLIVPAVLLGASLSMRKSNSHLSYKEGLQKKWSKR
jgi:hypothetical protein